MDGEVSVKESMLETHRVWFVLGICAVLAWPSLGAAQVADDPSETAPAEDPVGSEPDEVVEPDEVSESNEDESVLAEGDIEEEEAESAAEVQADEAPAREPLPWRNSFFSWTHGITPNSFFRDAQLSYDPLYYWSFNLAPRWYLDPATFFLVSQTLFLELTDDGNSGAYNRDPQLTDTVIELRRVQLLEGFIFIPAARVLLPVSKLSQSAQRYFGLGAGLTAVRVIPEAASLTIALIGRYQYWFAGRNTPATMGSYEGEGAPPVIPITPMLNPEGVVDAPFLDQASGATSARHVITAGLSVNVTPLSGLTVTASAFWLSQEGHGLAPACTAVLTSASGYYCQGDTSPTHWRHSTFLSLAVAYDIQPWLNLSIGWSNSTVLAPFFNNDGSIRGPFNPDNNFFLTASIQIDSLYDTIAHGEEDDGLTPEQRQRRRQGLSRRISTEEGSF